MEKFVVILDRARKAEGESVASELDGLPGVSVKGRNRSLIDVEVAEPENESALRSFAEDRGLKVARPPEPELMEPIDPLREK